MKMDDLSWLEKRHDEALIWLEERLTEAVQTHDALPGAIRQKVRTMFDSINISEPPNPDDVELINTFKATGQHIRRMDETFQWITLLQGKNHAERRVKQNIVFIRNRLSRAGKPLGWRIIGEKFDMGYETARTLYESCMHELLAAIRKHRSIKITERR